MWLLPEMLADLRKRSDAGATRYEMLGIAGLVRALLLDPMTIESTARRRPAAPAPNFDFTPYELRAERAPGGLLWHDSGTFTVVFATADARFTHPTVTTDLRRFLQSPVAQLHEKPVSVKEFVHAYSHVLGGVHLGRPKSPHEELLQSMVASLDHHTIHWSRTLQYIAVVTNRALLPLTE